MAHVLLLQLVDDDVSPLRVLLVEIVTDFHKRIGGAAHGREYYKVCLTGGVDEFAYILHSLWRTDGGTTKLHYFHYRVVLL